MLLGLRLRGDAADARRGRLGAGRSAGARRSRSGGRRGRLGRGRLGRRRRRRGLGGRSRTERARSRGRRWGRGRRPKAPAGGPGGRRDERAVGCDALDGRLGLRRGPCSPSAVANAGAIDKTASARERGDEPGQQRAGVDHVRRALGGCPATVVWTAGATGAARTRKQPVARLIEPGDGAQAREEAHTPPGRPGKDAGRRGARGLEEGVPGSETGCRGSLVSLRPIRPCGLTPATPIVRSKGAGVRAYPSTLKSRVRMRRPE